MRNGFDYPSLMDMDIGEVVFWAEENEALERAIAEANRRS